MKGGVGGGGMGVKEDVCREFALEDSRCSIEVGCVRMRYK